VKVIGEVVKLQEQQRCCPGGVVRHACSKWGKRSLARGRCDHPRAIKGLEGEDRAMIERGKKDISMAGQGRSRNRELGFRPDKECSRSAGKECAVASKLYKLCHRTVIRSCVCFNLRKSLINHYLEDKVQAGFHRKLLW
jgi:hypothetical protein